MCSTGMTLWESLRYFIYHTFAPCLHVPFSCAFKMAVLASTLHSHSEIPVTSTLGKNGTSDNNTGCLRQLWKVVICKIHTCKNGQWQFPWKWALALKVLKNVSDRFSVVCVIYGQVLIKQLSRNIIKNLFFPFQVGLWELHHTCVKECCNINIKPISGDHFPRFWTPLPSKYIITS